MRTPPVTKRFFWTPSASSSRWFRRSILLLVAPLVLVCVACASTTATTVRRGAPHSLPSSEWEQISLPVPATDIRGIAVSPADPATIFACAGQPISYWRSTDAGATWTRYTLTLGAAVQCSFSFAPDDTQLVTLQAALLGQDTQPCAHDTFYLSDDGGDTWRHLPPHTSIAPSNVSGWCGLFVTRRHLYLHYSFTFAPRAAQVSLLERSDDNGTNWVRVDRGLGANVLFSMPEVGPGDILAVTVTHVPTQPPTTPIPTNLWISANAGDSWQRASTLPQGAGTHLLSSQVAGDSANNAWPMLNHPFYALENEQISSNLYRERVLMSGDGHKWSLLPPLPVANTSVDRPGVLQVLGPLPDGRLAIWGPDPREGIPAPGIHPDQVSAFWVWLWDPTMQQWHVTPSPLKIPAAESCGLCWGASISVSHDGAVYLYTARFSTEPSGTTQPGMFRVRLPTRA